MIIDVLENFGRYYCLGKRFEEAFRFLAKNDAGFLTLGRHDIVLGEVYANVREYDVKDGDGVVLESHRRYADVQCVIEGEEIAGYIPVVDVTPATEYDENTDSIFYKGKGEHFALRTGRFAVFFPGDAHAVRISPPGGSHVKKVVVKVLIA
ncbi:MAG: YhcH/YjgK/YiaL family protein [Synergistaceae bacterium]|nr:YhcH/YjgK/YiaL family protein [Synergistaceae bacterium]